MSHDTEYYSRAAENFNRASVKPSIFLIVVEEYDTPTTIITYRPTQEEAESFIAIYNLNRQVGSMASVEEVSYF